LGKGGKTISVLVIGNGAYESNLDLCLAARAFGAHEVTFTTTKNSKLANQFKAVNRNWGGDFSVSFVKDWKAFLKSKKNYKMIYLTRYGIPIDKVKYALKTYKNIMLLVTLTENVKNAYKMSDFNVSITTQPHCSTAAIAVFLHTFYEGRELAMHFENAKYKVVPEQERIHVEKVE
jgi:tRNA (cytidine56-2'-O)-methyltransferase